MKLGTLMSVALGCMVASSAAAFVVPLPSGEATVPAADPVATAKDPLASVARLSVGKTLLLDARLGHESLSASGSGETYLFAQVTGAESAAVARAPKVSLGIVVDRSGSMKGDRIAKAMDAAQTAVDRMRDGDVVSVVAFDSRAEVIVPPTTISQTTRPGIVARIRGIRLGGDTCISCGLESAMHEIMASEGHGEGVSRMLLLSDGATNSGIRDVPGLRALASRMRDRGCTISTIGVDVDFDEKVMAAIANEANGRHYFVRNAAGLPEIFAQEFDSLVASVASDGELAITLAPGVEVEQVFDRAFRREGDKVIVPFGSVSKGQQKTVLLKLRLPVGVVGQRAVADLKLQYRDLVEHAPSSCGGALALAVGEGTTEVLDPFVSARLERSRTAQTLTQVNLLVEEGKLAEARQRLAGRRAELASAETLAMRAPPADKAAAPRARALDKDFEEQRGAIASAESFGGGSLGGSGFAQPPSNEAARKAGPGASMPMAAPAAPPPVAATKGAVRQNQAAAMDLAL